MKRFFGSVWFFPAILFALVLILTGFKINGSSIGGYTNNLCGNDCKDGALLLNEPRAIRSDEWLFNTSFTVAQATHDYSTINTIGSGQDISLLSDAPSTDWSTMFKPQNWSFFVLPLEYAFAFKWWLIGYLLIVSCYFFVLQILPGKRAIASLLGIGLFFSPFIQWWYQSITLAPLFYSLLIATAFIRFVHAKTTRALIGWVSLLSFLAICFAFIFYPAFQIPCALIILAFIVGYSIENKREIFKAANKIKQKVIALSIAALTSVVTIGLFVYAKYPIIKQIQESVYPGRRIDTGGGYNWWQLLSGPFLAKLQHTEVASFYPLNQSEASAFALVSLGLLPFCIWCIVQQKRLQKNIPWVLVSLVCVYIILIIYAFFGLPKVLASISLLSSSTPERVMIGLGLLNVFIITYTIKIVLNQREAMSKVNKNIMAIASAAYTVGLFISAGIYLHSTYPDFIGLFSVIAGAGTMGLAIFLLITKQFYYALSVLAILGIYSTWQIHPLYRGLNAVQNTPIIQEIKEFNTKQPGTWVTTGSIVLEQLPAMAGVKSLTGIQMYPDKHAWKPFDPKEIYSDSYDRYAHFVFQENLKSQFIVKQNDLVFVNLEPCSSAFRQSADYILSNHPLADVRCAHQVKHITYGNNQYYIYKTVKQ